MFVEGFQQAQERYWDKRWTESSLIVFLICTLVALIAMNVLSWRVNKNAIARFHKYKPLTDSSHSVPFTLLSSGANERNHRLVPLGNRFRRDVDGVGLQPPVRWRSITISSTMINPCEACAGEVRGRESITLLFGGTFYSRCFA